jgi:AAA domain/Bifunctional DNA primase/polymerase, N-terminal
VTTTTPERQVRARTRVALPLRPVRERARPASLPVPLPARAELIDASLELAAQGYRVVPLDNNRTPLATGWQVDAPADPDTIRGQFTGSLATGVGALVGDFSAPLFMEHGLILIVLDVDGPAGEQSLQELEARTGPLPATRQLRTRNGRHLWFHADARELHAQPDEPDQPSPLIGHTIARGLELKGCSRLLLPTHVPAPPSFRVEHNAPAIRYEWMGTGQEPVALAPQPLLDELARLRAEREAQRRSALPASSRVSDAPPTPYEEREAAHMLGVAVDRIDAAGQECHGRRTAIRDASFMIGHYTWALDREEVHRRLTAAARATGWTGDIATTVADGLNDGERDPQEFHQSNLWGRGYRPDPQATVEVRDVPLGAVQPASTPRRFDLICAAEVEILPLRWLWRRHIPAGMITILGGKGGRGKGLVCASLVASITTGTPLPCSPDVPEIGNVLWGETEDPFPQVLAPRLTAAGADLSRVTLASVQGFGQLDLPQFVRDNNVKLIVLSPMTSFLPALRDNRDEIHVRAALQNLQDGIEGTDCAVLGIAHLNKKSDLDAVERLLGSGAFANFVRSVLLVEREPDTTNDTSRLVLGKWNVTQPTPDLLYTPRYVGTDPRQDDQAVRVDWSMPEGGSVDATRLFERRAPQRNSAAAWLVSYLQRHGETSREDVMAAGLDAGHSEGAIRTAQQRTSSIQIRRHGMPARTLWSLGTAPGIAGMRGVQSAS